MKVINSENKKREHQEKEVMRKARKEEKKEKRKRNEDDEDIEERQNRGNGGLTIRDSPETGGASSSGINRGTNDSSNLEDRGVKRGAEEEGLLMEEERILRETLRGWDQEGEGLGEVPRGSDGLPLISSFEKEIDGWICEVKREMEDLEEVDFEEAWDDVHGGSLPIKLVIEARGEEVEYMTQRSIWSLRPIAECWQTTGKAPTSVRWVDTNKG